MEQQRTQVPAAAVEQYKREMMAQARRSAPTSAATYTEQTAQTPVQAQTAVQAQTLHTQLQEQAQPAQEHESIAERLEEAAERVAEQAEKAIEYAEPVAQSIIPALSHSGLAAAGMSAVAKGIELGIDALGEHLERRQEQRRVPQSAPIPNINIEVEPNIEITNTATAHAGTGYSPIMPLRLPTQPVAPAPPAASAPPMAQMPPMASVPQPRPTMPPVIIPQPRPQPVPMPTVPVPPQPAYGCVPEQPVIPCPCQRPIESCDNMILRPPRRDTHPKICPVHGPIKKQCAVRQTKLAPGASQAALAAMQVPAMQQAAAPEGSAATAESRIAEIIQSRPPVPPSRPPEFLPEPPSTQQTARCPVPPLCVCPVPPFNQVPFPGPCRPCPPSPSPPIFLPEPRPPIRPFGDEAAEQQAWYTQPAQGTDPYGATYAQEQYSYRVPEDSVAVPSSTDATDYADTLSKVAYMDPTVPPPVAGRTDANGTWELPSPQFASLDDFYAKNKGRGLLTMQTLVDESGTPVPGAHIKVTKNIGGVTYQFYDVQTDAKGEAGKLVLPAPEKQLSTQPPHGTAPYALYDVTVSLHGLPTTLKNVVIFADTESMQPVNAYGGETLDEIQYTI